jgi:PAS domain S-box-containing protein
MKPVIICVDDESLILDSIKMVLKENFGEGYSIETAESGDDALELIDELMQDKIEIPILISDYVMPGLKGDEFLIQAHNIIPDTLKIMLTGQADLRGVENVINHATLYRFLSKPWTTEDFVLTIGEALKSFAQARHIRIQNRELEISENKYKELVENSLDIIFSLDKEERIRTINQSITRILRYKPKNLIGKKFSELVYITDWMNEKIVQEKMLELIHTNEPVSFNCDMLTAAGEPKEMLIRLQFLPVSNGSIILGTASSIEEDLLIRLCETETQLYKIENYMTQIDMVCKRISNAITKYGSQEDVFLIKLCLMELLVNAMEHGNLDISFDEKSEALESNEYYKLLYNRQQNPNYKNKRIIVEFSLNSEKVEIRITDEGKGFDHKRQMSKAEKEGPNLKLAHGRGIQMAKSFFHTFEYNEKGNSVYLVRNFNS